MFAAAGVEATMTRETVVFEWPSLEEGVNVYMRDFGPFVAARRVLEPQGRWPEFVESFTRLMESFDKGGGGVAQIVADWLLITAPR